MFIDEATITVEAGGGGHGSIAFRREKFVPRGGPSGGDGGKGGDVYLVSNPHDNTLVRFRYNHIFRADRGQHGQGSNKHGKSAEDLVIPVPAGTLVYDDENGALLRDFEQPGERWLAARGGRGGHGNAHFASSVNRAPRKAQDGESGERRTLRLELKLLADVGLVGFPNAGKSTLISAISAAHPKVADYPFTTLEPSLGVVEISVDVSFVMADIPGLIEGAHEGHGLGLRFLRHIERTRLLLILVDVSVGNPDDPVDQIRILRSELAAHDAGLARRPAIVVATKIDAVDEEKLRHVAHWCGQEKSNFAKISSVTGSGLDDLKHLIVNKLRTARTTAVAPVGSGRSPGPRTEPSEHPRNTNDA